MSATVLPAGPEARAELERTIAAGGVALFPADGLYGLACDPLAPLAIERIHAIKGRDDGKPSAVMYFSPLALRELLPSLGERSREVLAALLPGPVTAILANPQGRYPLACRSTPEALGVRLIEGPLAGAMCPIFQTSANRSGEPAPAAFADADAAIVAAVDLAIDGGELDGAAFDGRRSDGDRGGGRLAAVARWRAAASRSRAVARRSARLSSACPENGRS